MLEVTNIFIYFIILLSLYFSSFDSKYLNLTKWRYYVVQRHYSYLIRIHSHRQLDWAIIVIKYQVKNHYLYQFLPRYSIIFRRIAFVLARSGNDSPLFRKKLKRYDTIMPVPNIITTVQWLNDQVLGIFRKN